MKNPENKRIRDIWTKGVQDLRDSENCRDFKRLLLLLIFQYVWVIYGDRRIVRVRIQEVVKKVSREMPHEHPSE